MDWIKKIDSGAFSEAVSGQTGDLPLRYRISVKRINDRMKLLGCLPGLRKRWSVSPPLQTTSIRKMWTLARTAVGWENPRTDYEASA